MLFLFKKTTLKTIATAFLSVKVLSFVVIAHFGLLVCENAYTATPGGMFGSERIIEPRLQKQIEEEERQKREARRKALEEKQKADAETKRRFYYGKTEDEKSEEEKEFEANKEYMSYWQRLRYSWKYAESFQDIFDQSLEYTYAPAVVKSAFLNIRSGPGRNYPSIYIAERDETIDFSAIRTEWYQIRTNDGHFGWVHMNDLPGNVNFEYENQGFADQAKTIATRSNPLDLGFMGGIMSDEPVMLLYLKKQNTHFISTELELGVSRGKQIQNDFISVNILAHPISEMKNRPHFLLGLGQMRSTYSSGTTEDTEKNMYAKAGIGLTREFSNRLRFRADLSQYAVESTLDELNHFSQLTIGSAYVWGSNTDPILNRSIGERVKVTDLEVSLFSGSVNLSNATTVANTGIRLSYHVSEDYFFEAHASQGSEDYGHIGVAMAKNLLTSEYVLPWRGNRNFWPTQFYALLGTGLQQIDEDEQVSVSIGAGFRVNPSRRFAIRIDGREYMVHQQVYNNQKSGKYIKNAELSFGLSYFF